MIARRELSLDEAKHQTRRAAREASPWIVRLGRFGYAAKGAVYVIVGALATQAARGAGGATTDPRGALDWIIEAPFGRFLLGAVAIGLVGYTLWCLVQGILDTESKGTDATGILTRGAFVFTGVVAAGLALSAVRLVRGTPAGGGNATQDWTAWLLSQPFGQGLVGIVGAIVIGSGLYHLYKAYSANFREDLKLREMTRPEAMWTTRIGRLGFAANGIAVGIIGGFLLVAALQAQPERARGLGGALETLARQPYGPWLLGAVAVGLIAYGLFMLVEARYRRMVIR